MTRHILLKGTETLVVDLICIYLCYVGPDEIHTQTKQALSLNLLLISDAFKK